MSSSPTRNSKSRRSAARPSDRRPPEAGPRTTLRLPPGLASLAQALAARDGVSRNDAVIRLAEVGAAHQLRLDAVAARAETRLAAWRGGDAAGGDRFPTADELEAALEAARVDEGTEAGE